MKYLSVALMFFQAVVATAAWAQGVTSFNTRTGAVTLQTSDVTTALSNQSLNLGTGSLTANGGLFTTGAGSIGGTLGVSGVASLSGGLSATFTQTVTASTIGWLTGTQTFSGTITGAFAPLNFLYITDHVAVPNGSGQGFYVQHHIGTSTVTGGRNAIQADLDVDSTTGNTFGQYGAFQGNCQSNVPDSAICYGANFTAQLAMGATGWQGIVGQENDVGIQSGASAAFVTGIQVVPFANWTVAGSSGLDTAYAIGYQSGAIGFDYGFRITGLGGVLPIKTTGAIFSVTSGGTVASGFALNGITITGDAWRSPGLRVVGGAANLANYVVLAGNASGSGPTSPLIASQGSTTNIDLTLESQGNGNFMFYSNGGSNQIFQVSGGSTSDGYVALVAGISGTGPDQLLLQGTGNNLLLGGVSLQDGTLATSAAAGFPMIPFTSGAPTGTPVNSSHGAALEANTSSKNVNVYFPGVGWYHIALTAGAN
jgi:hypothetical protein